MYEQTGLVRSIRVLCGSMLVITLVVVMGWAGAPSAHADERFRVAFTKIGIYPRSAPTMDAGKVGAALADGTTVTVACETTGTSVTSDAGTSNIWEKLSDGSYIPNVFIETGTDGWTPGVPRCGPASAPAAQTQRYDRVAAADYAKRMYTELNVGVIAKCTYFASAVLEAGGLPTTSSWTPESTSLNKQASRVLFYANRGHGPTKRWASADHLKNYLAKEKKYGTLSEVSLTAANPGVELGDLVMYDWGNEPDHGVIDHVAVVTGFAPDGTALVTQKELDQLDRPWNWSNSAKANFADANPGTRVYVIHITY